MVRYGVMCGVDGMVIDDGTVMRLAEDRFLVTTTTGGAARILDWMEEWLQTEWPQLRGPAAPRSPSSGPPSRSSARSRATCRRGVPRPGRQPTRPSRSWRGGTPRLDGVHVRVAPDQLLRRARLRGQRARLARARAVGAADRRRANRYGITPYGTETMHVLRAEKGYPIIGQDTDGTVTPHDLGMAGRCRRRSPTSSASARSPAARTTTRCASSSSGCCRSTRIPCCRRARRSSSSRRRRAAAAAGADARARHVELPQRGARAARSRWRWSRPATPASARPCTCPVDGTLVPVEVTGSVLVDPEGARRDG